MKLTSAALEQDSLAKVSEWDRTNYQSGCVMMHYDTSVTKPDQVQTEAGSSIRWLSQDDLHEDLEAMRFAIPW